MDSEGEREGAREAQKGREKKKEEARGICELHLVSFDKYVHITIRVADHSPCRRNYPATRIYLETHSCIDDVWWCVNKKYLII